MTSSIDQVVTLDHVEERLVNQMIVAKQAKEELNLAQKALFRMTSDYTVPLTERKKAAELSTKMFRQTLDLGDHMANLSLDFRTYVERKKA